MRFRDALSYAVSSAAPIVSDGAAEDVTQAEVDLARKLLARSDGRPFTPAEVEATARVASLGIEYWANSGYAEDDDVFGDAARELGDISEEGIRHALTVTFPNAWKDS